MFLGASVVTQVGHPTTGHCASLLVDGANSAYELAMVGLTVLTAHKWLQERLVMYRCRLLVRRHL